MGRKVPLYRSKSPIDISELYVLVNFRDLWLRMSTHSHRSPANPLHIDAIDNMESLARRPRPVILRYGVLYGPAPDPPRAAASPRASRPGTPSRATAGHLLRPARRRPELNRTVRCGLWLAAAQRPRSRVTIAPGLLPWSAAPGGAAGLTLSASGPCRERRPAAARRPSPCRRRTARARADRAAAAHADRQRGPARSSPPRPCPRPPPAPPTASSSRPPAAPARTPGRWRPARCRPGSRSAGAGPSPGHRPAAARRPSPCRRRTRRTRRRPRGSSSR